MARTINKKFPTGSYYFGTCNSMLALDGYGSYTYPDGTQYMGYFRDGLYNGHGRLIVYQPCKMTFIGNFQEGKLTEIDKIIFDDGLYFVVQKQGDEHVYTTDSWQYCSKKDRRFSREIYTDIVWKNITARANTRKIPGRGYDTEEGLYSTETGFINNIAKPFNKRRFVQCPEELAWIKRYCRSSIRMFDNCKKSKYGVPEDPVCRRIIKGDLNAMYELQGLYDDLVNDDCACNDFLRYFKDLDTSSSFRFLTTSMLNSCESEASLQSAFRRNVIAKEPEPQKTESIITAPMPMRSWRGKAQLFENWDQGSVKSENVLEEEKNVFHYQLQESTNTLV